jgi:hypothetical protein
MASSQAEAGRILLLAEEVQVITGLVQGTGIDSREERSLEEHASMERLVVVVVAGVMVEGRDRKAEILDLDGEIVEVVEAVAYSFVSACFACCLQNLWVMVVPGRLVRYCDS